MQPPELAAATQPSLDPSEQAIKPVNIGGWLLTFCLLNLLGVLNLVYAMSKLHETRVILFDLLSLSASVVVVLLIFLRSRLVISALYGYSVSSSSPTTSTSPGPSATTISVPVGCRAFSSGRSSASLPSSPGSSTSTTPAASTKPSARTSKPHEN